MSYSDTEYQQLLEQSKREIESIIYQLESNITSNLNAKVPQSIIFDTIPLIKKLSDALRFTNESLGVYEQKIQLEEKKRRAAKPS
mgnify:CR=1 FL=1